MLLIAVLPALLVWSGLAVAQGGGGVDMTINGTRDDDTLNGAGGDGEIEGRGDGDDIDGATDTVRADAGDSVARDCERIIRPGR